MDIISGVAPEAAVPRRPLGRRTGICGVRPPGHQRPYLIREALEHVDADRARSADMEPGDAIEGFRYGLVGDQRCEARRGGSGTAATSTPCAAPFFKVQSTTPVRQTQASEASGNRY